jgi:hypothetical protein
MILRKYSSLSKLIAQSMHQQFEHPVVLQMAKNKVREHGYLILGLDNLFREIKKHCITCKARENKPYKQCMAAIPSYRLEKPLQAFLKTGLDFAGSFLIKQGRARQQLKSHILVFTCLQTRAVHLEATNDQSTSSVIHSSFNARPAQRTTGPVDECRSTTGLRIGPILILLRQGFASFLTQGMVHSSLI